MSIRSSVGAGGVNAPGDVRLVQILLNAGLARFEAVRRLPIDGVVGPRTEDAIMRFQRHGVAMRRPNGQIAPGDQTLECLRDALPAQLSPEKLHATMPEANAADICRFYQPLRAGLRTHGIVSPLRSAHFLAQIGTESDDLACLETPLPDDGDAPAEFLRFRGRGLLKLTGLESYARYATSRGYDVVTEPQRLADDPQIAADAACWYWAVHGLNMLADVNDLIAITDAVAGGRHRLKERTERLIRTKWLFGL